MFEKNPESRNGTKGWIALAAGVFIFDCLSDETLTNAFKRGRESENTLVRAGTIGALAVTAAHLLDYLPPEYDPFDRTFEALGKWATKGIHIP